MSGGARTEAPTPRRLREARRRGEVGASRKLTGAAALAGGLCALALAGPTLTAALAADLRAALERAAAPAGGAALSPADPVALLRAGVGRVLILTLPVGGAALAAGGLAGALQSGWNLSLAAAAPRLDRLALARGLRALASPGALGAALLGLVEAGLLLALALGWLRRMAPALAALPAAGAPGLLALGPALGGLAARLAAAAVGIGLLDLALARRRLLRGLRMTRDEVRRELREQEGDPARRAERRRHHRALLEAPPVARATVVVVNPTHLAVALHHDRAAGEAPRVIAKGTGRDALRIRSEARRAGVPVVRDVALARALHRLAEVGDEIPEELYEAAAAVLAHLYGLGPAGARP